MESRGHGVAMKLYTHHPKYDGDHQKALQFAKGARDMVKEEFDKRWPPDQGSPKIEKKDNFNKKGSKKIKQPSKRIRPKEPEVLPQEPDEEKNVD